MRVSGWTAATLVWILLAGGACLAPLFAQTGGRRAEEPAAADKVGKELHALRVSANPTSIPVDGRIDDEAWMRTQAISDLTQEDPDNMMPPTEPTTVRVAYDDRYLYIAVQMSMRDGSALRDGLGRRGSAPPSDRVFVAFDTAHDHQNAYVFEVNASGVQNDYLQVGDTNTNNDYEAVWEVATLQTGHGWNAEFRIPFSQMRFPEQAGDKTVWGFNIRRDLFARGEQDWWVARPRGAQGIVSRFGHLVFDDRLTPPRRFEFTPYVLGQLRTESDQPASGAANAGFDLRLGLGSSASLSATVNPDFGQVEADPSVLNLSVFETFFPEKRPFFLEDSQTFVLPFGLFPDFYSRRIGQQPNHFELTDNETLVTKPDTTTIFGAVKPTGKTSPLDLRGADCGHIARGRRRRRDRRGGLPRDFHASRTKGDRAAVCLQRCAGLTHSARGYVKRRIHWDERHPRARRRCLPRRRRCDAARRPEPLQSEWPRRRDTGADRGRRPHWLGGLMNADYTTKYYNVNGHLDRFSPSFRNSDMGSFFARPDRNEASGGVFLYQPDPKRFIRNSRLNVYGGRQWNADHLLIGGWTGINGNVNFTNFWNVFIGLTRRPSQYDDVGARGGPPIVSPAASWMNVRVESDSRKQWGGSLSGKASTRRGATFAGRSVPQARTPSQSN